MERRRISRLRRIPKDWQDKPAKLFHKNRRARWTLKFTKAKRQDNEMIPSTDFAIPFFSYKSHISIDLKWKTTNTTTSDGTRLRKGLLDRSNTVSEVWTDTVYRSKANTGQSVIHSCVKHVFADP